MNAFKSTKLLTVELVDGYNQDEVLVNVYNYYGKLDSIDYFLKLNGLTDIESKETIDLPYDRN